MNLENFVILFVMIAIAGAAFWGVKLLKKKFQSDFNRNVVLRDPDGKGSNLSLTRINGCGMAFNGSYREVWIDNVYTYVSYYTLHILFLPLIPFKAYRVSPAEGGYYILGSDRMALKEVGVNFLNMFAWVMAVASVAFLVFGMIL